MDIEALPNCTCFNLRKATRAVTQAYDEALKPTGLRATQLSMLNVLSQQGPTTMTDLADALVMDRTTLTRNLKPLIERNLVAAVDATDRRRRPVALTPRGRAAQQAALPLWQAVQSRIAQALGPRRWAGLIGDLIKAVEVAKR